MDTAELTVEYTEDDFANAIRAFLPNGEYWQEADNQELTNVIIGMAADFKLTNDEIQLSLLTDFSAKLFGWKLSDYQALLVGIAGDDSGTVFDDEDKPNFIYVSLSPDVRSEEAWFEFEKVRLPHTSIEWLYNATINVQTQIANARHIRNVHKYEVTQ